MLLYSVGALWVIAGQHSVAAWDQICKDVTTRMGEVEDWMTNFDVRIIKFDTSLEITRKLAGQHDRAQHSGRESSVPQLLNNFLQLAAGDTQCKKTFVALMCEAWRRGRLRNQATRRQSSSKRGQLPIWP